MWCSINADTSLEKHSELRKCASSCSVTICILRASQESTEMQHWPTLCLIKDPLGSHKCFEQFDAVLMEIYDQPRPMVRAQLFSLGSNLLMHQASVQALLYAHVLMKALIYIFFSPGLSVSLPGTKHQPFLTTEYQSAPTLLPSSVTQHGFCFSPERGIMACCPNLDSVLILSARRLVAGGNAKLLMPTVPSFCWHEHDTSIPLKQSRTQQGTWQWCTAYTCVLCSCVRTLSLPVLSVSQYMD